MGATALTATVALYLATALDFWLKGARLMAGAFVCYAVANVFFLGIVLR